ncbi:MAG TPA: membrane protein insertion efficiency factor YidD [Prosthecobacter sp.]
MKWLVRILIRGYQRVISPVIHSIGGPGSGCRFTPTCSEYFLQAVETHGLFKGGWLGTWRILRCNPWGGHGHDPVPPAVTKESCSCQRQKSAECSLPASPTEKGGKPGP